MVAKCGLCTLESKSVPRDARENTVAATSATVEPAWLERNQLAYSFRVAVTLARHDGQILQKVAHFMQLCSKQRG